MNALAKSILMFVISKKEYHTFKYIKKCGTPSMSW